MAPVCCRPDLGLPADDLWVGEAPGLRRGDHRTGEHARIALPPRPGSVQSCDGHPRPAGAGGRDGRTHGVGGGGDRRAAGPCMHVEWRRPHDAEARHQPWRMWTNDRLNHGVAPRSVKRKTKNRAADALCESNDSPGDHHVRHAAANCEHRDATPCIESSQCADGVNDARSASASARAALVLARDWFSRCSDAQARPRRWIARREAVRRGFVHVGEYARVLTGAREVFVELGDRWLSVRRPRHLVLLFALTLHTPREMKTFTVGYFVGDLARPVDPDFAFAFAGAADWNSAPA